MTFDDAQRAYDNEAPDDYEDADDRCPDCKQRKCQCDALDKLVSTEDQDDWTR